MGGCYSKKATAAALRKKYQHMERRPTAKAHRGGGGKKASGGGGGGGGGGGLHTSSTQLRGKFLKVGGREDTLRKKGIVAGTPTPATAATLDSTTTATTTATTTTTTGLVTPASRTRSASKGSGGASPRGPHKPSSVAPAPPCPASRPGSLNRFGFRSSGGVKPGDSTDSVNSILSDAQTASDSTPDLCDLCDLENGNTATPRLPDNSGNQPQEPGQPVPQQPPTLLTSPPQQVVDTRHLDSPVARVGRPESVSGRASDGTSAESSPAPSGRITATTRQLPKPQIVTVRNFPSPRAQTQPQAPHTSQGYTDLSGRGRPSRPAPRVSRDSESSSRSTTEADSGLGSSSEGDRIARGEEAGDTDTLDSATLEFPEDVSELWLREKRGSVLEVGRGGTNHLTPHSTLELAFRGSGSVEVKRRGLEVKVTGMPSKGVAADGGGLTASSPPSVLSSPPERKGKGGKERREGPITYGMARQKFAPYSRNRFGYYHGSYQSRTTTDAATATTTKLSTTTTTPTTNKAHNGNSTSENCTSKSTSPTTGRLPTSSPPKTSLTSAKTHTTTTRSPPSHQYHSKTSPSPLPPHSNRSPPNHHHHTTTKTSPPPTHTPTTGLVKSRVALLETPPQPQSKKSPPQPPAFRRTPLKKPLVRPTSLEKSPSLVMPVTERNVELSKPVFRRLEYLEYSEGQKDTTLALSRAVAEDILIVGSVETETLADNTGEVRSRSQGEKKLIERSLKKSPTGDLALGEVTKASQDAKEREKVLMESSMEASVTSVTSDLTMTPHNLTPDGSKILTPQSESSFEILESLSETLDVTLEETKEEEELDDLTSSSSPSSLPSDVPPPHTTPVPPPHTTPTQAYMTPHTHPHSHTATSPTTDHHKPLSQLLSTLKSSLDSRASVESPGDPQRSPTEPLGTGTHHLPLALTNSSSGPSGTCTPILTSARDLDLDFLIDDEIADQPGLTFGDEGAGGAGLSTSFFGDDEFDELVAAVAEEAVEVVETAASPTHHHHHHASLAAAAVAVPGEGCARPRADSLDTTTSSLTADDLMLDFEARYDEEVMSPDASEIFSEWTAMMADMGANERCAPREGSCGSGRVARPRQGSLTEGAAPDPRRPMVLRPPRQGSVGESDGSCGSGGSGGSGGVYVDRTTYHYMYQDVTALKTMLLRLRRMLQAADTINPFDANLRNSLYLSLASSESPGLNGEKDSLTPAQVCQENVDLRRQVVLLQQQLEDRDRTIRLLQQQLSQSLSLHHHSSSSSSSSTTTPPAAPHSTSTASTTTDSTVNAATQTERLVRTPLTGSSLSRAASIDDGLGPTVSFRLGKQVHVF